MLRNRSESSEEVHATLLHVTYLRQRQATFEVRLADGLILKILFCNTRGEISFCERLVWSETLAWRDATATRQESMRWSGVFSTPSFGTLLEGPDRTSFKNLSAMSRIGERKRDNSCRSRIRQ